MATQSLEFGYTPGQTLTAELFAIGGDTVVQTASSVTERTNAKGRYVAVFTDAPAANYMLIYYLSGTAAGSEKYVVTLATETFQPASEIIITGTLTLEDVAAAGTTGNGEFARTVRVEDGSGDGLQGARVTVLETSLKQTTPTDGEVTFNLDSGTYTVRVSAPSGFADPDDQTVTVSADGTTTFTLISTGDISPPDNPDLSTVTVRCVDEAGANEADVTVNARLIEVPSGGTGVSYDGIKQAATSDANGVAQLTLVRLAVYEVRRGNSKQWKRVTIADQGTQELPSFVGTDA